MSLYALSEDKAYNGCIGSLHAYVKFIAFLPFGQTDCSLTYRAFVSIIAVYANQIP